MTVIYLPILSLCTGLNPETVFSENILSIDRHIDFRKIYYLFYIRMGSVGCLAKGGIFFWQNILKNRSKYRGDISEQNVVCTVLISTIIIEIFRKNIPISYIIPYKNLASPLIPVCLKTSHMTETPVEGVENSELGFSVPKYQGRWDRFLGLRDPKPVQLQKAEQSGNFAVVSP